jgi:hypothetical protein
VLAATSITRIPCDVEKMLPTETENNTWSVGIATKIFVAGGSAAGKVIIACRFTGYATGVTSRVKENYE